MQTTLRLSFFALLFCSQLYAQLRIVAPNGGEVLTPGSTYSIQWAGVPTNKRVTLELSTDGGSLWTPIAQKVSGLSYDWSVPNTISTTCLLRATLPNQIIAEDSFLTDAQYHSDVPAPSQMLWGANSNILAFGGANKVFDVNKNLQVLFDDSVSNDCCIALSPDENTIVLRRPWGADMFDIASGSHLRRFDKSAALAFSVAWLNEDSRQFLIQASRTILFDIALVDGVDTFVTSTWSYYMYHQYSRPANRAVFSFSSGIPYAIGFDLTTLDSLYELNAGEPCYSVKMSADGQRVATFGQFGAVKIWNTADGSLISSFTLPDIQHFEHTWSLDNRLAVATTSDSMNVYNTDNGTLLYSLHCPNTSPRNIAYRPGDSKYLLTQNGGRFLVFDGSSGALLQDFNHTAVSPIGGVQFAGDGNMQWSPDGKKIALRDASGRFIIYYIDEQAGQFDLSDNPWSINNAVQAAFPVRIGIDSAFAGDTVYLPIILNDPQSVLAQGATLVRVTCSYNTTMLLPLPDPNTNRDVAGRVDFAISLNASMDTVIGLLPFQAGLGTAISTALKIELATTNSPLATLTPTDGLFTLRGICYEGGPRLMNPAGVPSITVSRPQATDVQLPVTITLVEEGWTKLSLVDMLGRTTKLFLNDRYAPGDHKLQMNLTGIANGTYMLILETPTQQITKTIEVAR